MSTDRREFLRLSAAAGGALGLGLDPLAGEAALRSPPAEPATGGAAPPHPPARAPLRMLILGGTGFIGPHMVRYAVERGHEVSIFTRGRSEADIPDVEQLVGDRNDDLSALRGRTWDVVMDNNAGTGRAPWWVEGPATLLRDSVDRYYFVSTRSVYATLHPVPMTADAPTFTIEGTGADPQADSFAYGLAKAEAERRVHAIIGSERAAIFRPGLIIGPGDETDRFTYWPVRIERGGEVLAPGDGWDPVQIIDVRDLVEWMVRMAEAGESGVYNCVGPRVPRPFSELLYGIRGVTDTEAIFTWVDTDWLLQSGVRPYSDLPVWRPSSMGPGFARFDLSVEVEKGLTFRSLATTAADTLEFHHSRPAERQSPLRAGLSPDDETDLIQRWHDRPGAPGRRDPWLGEVIRP